MSAAELEQALRQIDRIGTRLGDDGRLQRWGFAFAGRPYELRFHVRPGTALREFTMLQALQRGQVAAPRAVALLQGFNLGEQRGDAVLVEASADAVPLAAAADAAPPGAPGHVDLLRGAIELLGAMGRARLSLRDASLAHFAARGGRVILVGFDAVSPRPLRTRDLLRLADDARLALSRVDRVRAWRALAPASRIPRRNAFRAARHRRVLRDATRPGSMIEEIDVDGWTGWCLCRADRARAWSRAGDVVFSPEDWARAWRSLADTADGTLLKDDRSGQVRRARRAVAGVELDLVLKRPRRRGRHVWAYDLVRRSRARRAWIKTWRLLARDIPCELPLLMLERRRWGYVVESVLVCEAVPGPTLAACDLDRLDAPARERLFRRAGRVLRRIDAHGFSHFDAKSTNWIVFDDPRRGPDPVLLDADGTRAYPCRRFGLNRLIRAVRQHPRARPSDERALREGYEQWSGD